MNRRDAIRTMTVGGLGVVSSGFWVDTLRLLADEQSGQIHAMVAGASQGAGGWTAKAFSPHQLETVATLADLIIPTTGTPGARTAQVDRIIDGVIAAAQPADRKRFLDGLAWIDKRSKALNKTTFIASTPAQQAALLTALSSMPSTEAKDGTDFFTAIKSMTISGYYSTEIGLRQELGDDGRLMLAVFEGCTHPEHY